MDAWTDGQTDGWTNGKGTDFNLTTLSKIVVSVSPCNSLPPLYFLKEVLSARLCHNLL